MFTETVTVDWQAVRRFQRLPSSGEKIAASVSNRFNKACILLTVTALAADFQPVTCAGACPHHLQGVGARAKGSVF